MIEKYIQILVSENYEETITPIKLMELNGAPVADKHWMKGHQMKIVKLREMLRRMKEKNLITEVEIGYQIVKRANV